MRERTDHEEHGGTLDKNVSWAFLAPVQTYLNASYPLNLSERSLPGFKFRVVRNP